MTTTTPPTNVLQVPNINEAIAKPDSNGNLVVTQRWWSWFDSIWRGPASGFNGTIQTAPVTTGGTPGTITYVNGRVVSHTGQVGPIP
jgi:hypothetical protein